MPKLSPNSVTLLDGIIVLSRRSESAKWQAHFTIANRRLRISTKEKDLKDAKEKAEDLYLDAKYRAKNNIPVQTKRFKDVAKLAIDRMQKALDGGEGKKVYRDYIQAINNYLIPFFGTHHVDSLNYPMIKEFGRWRADKMGKEPKASTLNTHNSALNRIFDEAVMRGYVAKLNIPMLENKGRDAQRRPDFTIDEYRKIYRGFRTWIHEGREGKSRDMRALLRDYVLILANTGIRHGTEAENLRWKHISKFNDSDGRSYLAMYVKGKTKGRELVARHSCEVCLKRIHERCADISHMSFDDLLKSQSDLPVFRLSDGTVTKSLNQTFRGFMRDVGLLKDTNTSQNRTLYSLRHMYATFQIVYGGIDLHVLATQMGTSLAMIEQHYSHLKPRMKAAELTGATKDIGHADLKLDKLERKRLRGLTMKKSESTPLPLTEAELDTLRQGLRDFGGEHPMNLETLDGFLAALVCGPDEVPQGEYLEEIWGENIVDEDTFIAQPILQDLVFLVIRHRDNIAHTLRSGDVFLPLLLEDEQGISRANDWATGFMRGLELRGKEWAFSWPMKIMQVRLSRSSHSCTNTTSILKCAPMRNQSMRYCGKS